MQDEKENNREEGGNGSSGGEQPKKRRRIRVGDVRGGQQQRVPYRSSDQDRAPVSSVNREPRERVNRDYQSREGRDYQSRDKRYFDNRDDRRTSYGDRDRVTRSSYQSTGERPSYQRPQAPIQKKVQGPKFNRPQQRQENRPKRLVKPVKYKETFDPEAEVRLNKYLANAGVCSRREADTYIQAGEVKVNGVVVSELGAKVKYGDEVTFKDQPLQPESKIYVLLNKPKNFVTTSDDPENRATVMDLVKNACTERIYPVGRLDRNTTGVLLLTNDGDLASKLMHPKFKKKKIYQVTLDKDVAPEHMQAIADGIELDDGEIHADSIAYNSEDKLNVVGIEIHSGRNRIVRRIFEKLGYRVVKLDRVYFSGLTKKNVPRGKWRYLTPDEVNMLRMGAFE